MTTLGPLAGLRVVEVASFISGPFASMMLADLGATVTKVEDRGGDIFRRFMRPTTTMSPQFANVNRNKSSVRLDLRTSQDQDELWRLLERADVLVTNLREQALAKIGLDDALLAKHNTRLIRCYVTGFGREGPDAGRPAFDAIIQARAGMTDAWGSGRDPSIMPNYLADLIAATMTAQAVLAGLVSRDRTGIAERIDIAMLDAVAYFQFPSALAHRTFVDDDEIGSPLNPHTSPTRPIACADGWLVVTPVSRAHIEGACRAINDPTLATELLGERDGVLLTQKLVASLERATMRGNVDTWLDRFSAEDVPAAKCLTVDEHLDDPQVLYNEIYGTTTWPEVGKIRHPRYPARFVSWPRLDATRPAPPLAP